MIISIFTAQQYRRYPTIFNKMFVRKKMKMLEVCMGNGMSANDIE